MAVVRSSGIRNVLRFGVFGAVIIALSGQTVAQELCWDPAAIKGAPSESKIFKSVRKAFVALPEGRPLSVPPIPHPDRHVIRRVKLPPGKKLVALTFDLCEQPNEIAGYQADVVDFLREHQVHATFFAGGKWLLTHRTRAEQLMTDRLFEVGNHSWEHRNLRLLSGKKLADEIDGAQLAYEQVRGDLVRSQCVVPGATVPVGELARPRIGLFRFPFGACDQKSLEAIWERGLKVIQWDLSSGDPWAAQKPKSMTRWVLRHAKPGSIIIFHANGRGHGTGKALPEIVHGLREKGFQFVTVSELLAAGEPEYAASKYGCYDHKPGDAVKYDKISARLEGWYERSRRRVLGKRPPQPIARRMVPQGTGPLGNGFGRTKLPTPSVVEPFPPSVGQVAGGGATGAATQAAPAENEISQSLKKSTPNSQFKFDTGD